MYVASLVRTPNSSIGLIPVCNYIRTHTYSIKTAHIVTHTHVCTHISSNSYAYAYTAWAMNLSVLLQRWRSQRIAKYWSCELQDTLARIFSRAAEHLTYWTITYRLADLNLLSVRIRVYHMRVLLVNRLQRVQLSVPLIIANIIYIYCTVAGYPCSLYTQYPIIQYN